MVVDTSALLAILLGEHDAPVFAKAIQATGTCRISAANYLEVAIVIDNRRDPVLRREFDRFFRRSGIIIEPVTAEQAFIARQAHRDFGKGKHPAGLNFGDCLAYALAQSFDEPLLFKGDDFSQTDVRSAVDAQPLM